MARLYWILDEMGTPVPAANIEAWAVWLERADRTDGRRIARDEVGSLTVSTVFLALDHGMFGGGLPILFETMIFGASDAEYCERYRTRVEAEAGHALAVKIAQQYVRERAAAREP